MPVDPCATVGDLEKAKFDTNQDNEVCVRTCGTFSLSGLSLAVKVTTLVVGTTAVKLPAVALTNRNSIAVHNKDSSQILYIGDSTITADTVVGITSGWEIDPNSFIQMDIQDDIDLYGIVASGTITIKVMELA